MSKGKDQPSGSTTDLSEFNILSGQKPLEWLELKDNETYSRLDVISGERKFITSLKNNPVVLFGFTAGLAAIMGGLYSISIKNHRMSNNFLKLRWGSSTCLFGFVVYKMWDRIDWEPPQVLRMKRYLGLIPEITEEIVEEFVEKTPAPVVPLVPPP